MDPFSAGIAAVASIAGAKLASKSTNSANKRNTQTQYAINERNLEEQYKINRENLLEQRRVNLSNRRATANQNAYDRQMQREINAQNVAMQKAINLENVRAQDTINQRNIALARETNAQQIALAEAENLRDQQNWETSRQDALSRVQNTVKDALAAGINPLTAIRGGATAGGGSGGTGGAMPVLTSPRAEAAIQTAAKVHAVQGSRAQAYAAQGLAPTLQAPQITPNTAFGDSLVDLGATIFTAFANQPDPEREALEKMALVEDIRSKQEQRSGVFARDFGYGIPRVEQLSGIDHGSIAESGSRNDDGYGGPRTPYKSFGINIRPSPWFSDSETVEARSGDVGSVPHQIGTTIADWGNTLRTSPFRYADAQLPTLRRDWTPRTRQAYRSDNYIRDYQMLN